MTDNYLYLGLLAILFPNATFIHSRRDLRDVAVSCWITSFRGIRWTNDPQHMAHRFQQYLRLMDHWRTVLPAPIHEVDYEETVDDLEGVARRLVAACGLDWEPACLDFHRTERPVRTSSLVPGPPADLQKVRRPLEKLRTRAGRPVLRPDGHQLRLMTVLAAFDSTFVRVPAESRAGPWQMRLLHGVGSLVPAGVRCIDRPGRMATSLQPSRRDRPFRVRSGAGDPRRTGSFPRRFARQTGDAHRTRRRPEPRRRLDSKTCLRAEGSGNRPPSV